MKSPIGRLRTTADFQQVYRTGRAVRGRGFILRVAEGAAGEPTAVGFVVGTKVSRSAVVRNRIRRRAREFVRRHATDIVPGRAVAVMAGAAAPALSSAETTQELSRLFKQATLIR